MKLRFTPTQDYYWATEYYHPDNMFTMQDFLDNHLSSHFDILEVDGSYAEIKNIITGTKYAVDAKGNGDSFNHVVTSGLL